MKKKLPDRIRVMYGMYGEVEGKKCKGCSHFLRLRHHDKIYFKCGLNRISHGAATDWRANWTACGRSNDETEET